MGVLIQVPDPLRSVGLWGRFGLGAGPADGQKLAVDLFGEGLPRPLPALLADGTPTRRGPVPVAVIVEPSVAHDVDDGGHDEVVIGSEDHHNSQGKVTIPASSWLARHHSASSRASSR